MFRIWGRRGARSRTGAIPYPVRPRLEALEDRLAPATVTWSGRGSSENWTNSANWMNSIVPRGGDDLIFPGNALQFRTRNDFTVGTFFNSLTIRSSLYTFRGAAISLGPRGLIHEAGGLTQFGLDLLLTATPPFLIQNGILSMTGTIGGASGLTKQGAGVLVLAGRNSYRGPTTLQAGTLVVSNNTALGTGSLVLNGGTLQAPTPVTLANPFTVGGPAALAGAGLTLSGTGNLGGGPLTIANDSGTVTLAGTLAGGSDLVKQGAGTLVLSGTDTFSGRTLVNGGSLLVNGQHGGETTVAAGATLGGTGTLGTVIVTAGGTLSPGPAPGILHADTVTLAGGSTFAVTLNGPGAGTDFSPLQVAGSVSLNGSTLLVTVGAALAEGASFPILNGTVRGVFNGLPEGAVFARQGSPFRITYSNGVVLQRISPAPWEAFVGRVYQDLLGRAVDPLGLRGWTDYLLQGNPRVQMAGLILTSDEYRRREVQDLYQRYLHRAADPAGLGGFLGFLAAGGTAEQLAALLAGSLEYDQQQAGGTVDGFLDALYRDALNRGVDPGGRAVFRQALANGATHEQVAAVVLGSVEYRQDFVQGGYARFLGRTADPDGLNGFVQLLQTGGRDEDVLAALLGSEEYFRRP